MIHQSKNISIEEKGKLIQMMYDQSVRGAISDVLVEITHPKRIENLECLKMIADLIRFVLTLFVHE
jgi:hypothetical protein